MNTPTHEEVSQRARQIWQTYGQPEGRDVEIWCEAERQLLGKSTPTSPPAAESRGTSPTASASLGSTVTSEALPNAEQSAIASSPENRAKAEVQKKSARAPKVAVNTTVKAAPAETGKPLWSKPHSS
jgi:hypothetical protein